MGLAIALVGYGMLASPLFRLRHIDVLGVTQTAVWQRASGLKIGTNLLFVHASALAARLQRVSPYIKDVIVRINWPNTVLITPERRRALAEVWGANGQALWVDRAGMALPLSDTATGHLPTLVGSWPTPAIGRIDHNSSLQRLLAVVAGMPTAVRSEVSQVAVGRGALDVYLNDGTQVRVSPNPPLSSWRSLSNVLRAARQDDVYLSSVDLRNPARPLVSFASGVNSQGK